MNRIKLKHSWLVVAVMSVLVNSVLAEEVANVALVATGSTSYVSGDTRVSALNDGIEPRKSDFRDEGCYGNWPKQKTQWVQYDWSRPISTEKISVYWWDDHMGVRLPKAARLYYWDGEAFKPVKASGAIGVERDQWNDLSFEEVITTRLRLEIDGNEEFSTGILEWKVFDSGKSSTFPPRVKANADRSVMLNGKTYLGGDVSALSGDCDIQWSKVSGPGEVTFADSGDVDTTATFSELGEYELQLKAEQNGEATADTLHVTVVHGPPAENLSPVDTMPYKIDSPLWNQRAKAIIVNWIPHCIDTISKPDLKEGGINNFVEAAKKLRGEEAEKHRGYIFSNAWVYNTIEAMCVAQMVDPQGDQMMIAAQQKMHDTLEDWIPKILAAQEPDGYLQTAFTLHPDRKRWSDKYRTYHEGYVAGYFLEAAVSHYMMTGGKDLRLYNAAKKLADCWEAQIGPPPKQRWWDEHQAMEMALVCFGRFVNTVEGDGKGDKYIALAKFLLDCRSGGNEYSQSHVPVTQQYEAVGHAVRASYNYAGMSDVAMETQDIDYQSAVMSLFDNMINRKYYVTGGIGSGETSEGFGPDYSLRHEAYCESCSSCGLIYFEHKLTMAYHEAKYADLYEETLFNALLGSLDQDGNNFYYTNALTEHGARYPWHVCPCCVGNIPRVLLMMPTWMYAKDASDIYVNMFVGSTITVPGVGGTDVQMVQKTDYPWDGNIKLTVNPGEASKFALHIRQPVRDVSELYEAEPDADGILWIKLNGETIEPAVENGYAVIDRTWEQGDTVEFELPMKIQRIHASEKVAATRGQVALRYGPMIYTFESADQPLDKALASDAELSTQWKPNLLGGVMVITGKWADGSDLQAIPFYARSNRIKKDEQGPVSKVWIKEQ